MRPRFGLCSLPRASSTRSIGHGFETIGNRCFARTLQGVFLELPRHYQLVWRVDLGKLTAASICATVFEPNDDAPPHADTQVRLPVVLAVVVGVAPPAFDLVGRQGLINAFRRSRNFAKRDDRSSAAVRNCAGNGSFCCSWRSVVRLADEFLCHFSSTTWPLAP